MKPISLEKLMEIPEPYALVNAAAEKKWKEMKNVKVAVNIIIKHMSEPELFVFDETIVKRLEEIEAEKVYELINAEILKMPYTDVLFQPHSLEHPERSIYFIKTVDFSEQGRRINFWEFRDSTETQDMGFGVVLLLCGSFVPKKGIKKGLETGMFYHAIKGLLKEGDQFDALIKNDFSTAIVELTKLTYALNAENVDQQRVVPDEQLQKARKRRKKPPKPAITYVRYRENYGTNKRGEKGTHASPHTHRRRGHPRHLSGGRIVWVRDTVVNLDDNYVPREYYRI